MYLRLLPCYFVAILHLFSQPLSTVLWCGGRLLNVTFSFIRARFRIRRPGIVPIRVSCRCVIDVVWLGLVCCPRLIRTLITVWLSFTDLYYARGAQGVLPMRVGGATRKLDLPSLTTLSVAGCDYNQEFPIGLLQLITASS